MGARTREKTAAEKNSTERDEQINKTCERNCPPHLLSIPTVRVRHAPPVLINLGDDDVAPVYLVVRRLDPVATVASD